MLGPDLNDLCDGEGVDGLEALLLGLNSKLGALLKKKSLKIIVSFMLLVEFP